MLWVFPIASPVQSQEQPDFEKPGEDLFEGFVYYANLEKTHLRSVKRQFAASLDSQELAVEIVHAVIAGPMNKDAGPTWPDTVKINAVFILPDQSAYIDLDLDAKSVRFMDTRGELLAVYSMVNSLTVNIPEIKRVKFLIKGDDAATLAGHIDLSPFYQTNMLIVK